MEKTRDNQPKDLIDRLGIPRALIWGFIGLTIFMIGDGVETNILEPFLRDEHGFSTSRVGTLVTVYGIAVAIAAFFAAALSDLWGPRKVMFLGAVVWVVLELAFLTLALTTSNPWLIFITYGLRGFGYPLFAYGFLVWITAVAPAEDRATGVGWFYVGFSAGLPTLGALTATISLSWLNFDFYQTLWVSLSLVIIGATIAFVGIREQVGRKPLVDNPEEVTATLSRGFKLLLKDRRARHVTYIRTINSVPTYAMAVYFPAYFTDELGWQLGWFLILTTVIYAVNLPFNPLYGRIGDRLGWARTMFWAGAIACAVTLSLVYFTPLIGQALGLPDNFVYGVTLFFGALFGVSLAGYVPLSAIAVALDPEHPGAAMSTYNLGVGAAVAVGPLLVAVFLPLVGATGLTLIMVGLYLFAAYLSHQLRGNQPGHDGVPENIEELPVEEREAIKAANEI
ncbi:MAG TPA: MFS transporter [Candidatus Corynebacterium avicola]|uniref:MFS transporter n=1 Tax=Candidatus Corynebacterium avicola TaxID=2838527 RepID=A0A9D1RQ34_9CORY|nr:MFS transporter [Candidatus Corynebacterium avicola]